MYCARVIISGIVIIEIKVLTETKFAEVSVSASYFAENIVVAAATGEQMEITEETSIISLTPQTQRIRRAIRGRTTSLNAIAKMHFISLKVLKISLLAR